MRHKSDGKKDSQLSQESETLRLSNCLHAFFFFFCAFCSVVWLWLALSLRYTYTLYVVWWWCWDRCRCRCIDFEHWLHFQIVAFKRGKLKLFMRWFDWIFICILCVRLKGWAFFVNKFTNSSKIPSTTVSLCVTLLSAASAVSLYISENCICCAHSPWVLRIQRNPILLASSRYQT